MDLLVAPNGTDSNPGTIDQPTTLQRAITAIAAGRTIASTSEWPANNLILNCTSYDNYDPDNGEDADGFACKLTTGPGNVFRGCIADNNKKHGFTFNSNPGSITVTNNRS